MWWAGFICGIWAGVFAGILVAGICAGARLDELEAELERMELQAAIGGSDGKDYH